MIIGFEGMQSLDAVGPFEVFDMANRFAERRIYRPLLASDKGGAIECGSGLVLDGSVPLRSLPDPLDTILVAGGGREAVEAARLGRIPAWIEERREHILRIGSVCSGALILAAAGLLDGRRATTHWGFCEWLRASHPAVQVEQDAIFVADPPIYTSAGVSAGIDLALALVEQDCGAQIALAVARNLVLFIRRAGGQSQFSPALALSSDCAPRLSRVISEVALDPRGRMDVTELAARAGMSERNFARLLKKQAGVTPAVMVQSARIDWAKKYLESSDWPLPRIAERSGFGSVASLHRAFRTRLQITPDEYRRHFGRTSLQKSPGS